MTPAKVPLRKVARYVTRPESDVAMSEGLAIPGTENTCRETSWGGGYYGEPTKIATIRWGAEAAILAVDTQGWDIFERFYHYDAIWQDWTTKHSAPDVDDL